MADSSAFLISGSGASLSSSGDSLDRRASRGCSKACRMLRLRHLRTRPYTPRTNRKAERFIQTLLREWACALPYRSSDTRAADLPRWLRHYHHERPILVTITQRVQETWQVVEDGIGGGGPGEGAGA